MFIVALFAYSLRLVSLSRAITVPIWTLLLSITTCNLQDAGWQLQNSSHCAPINLQTNLQINLQISLQVNLSRLVMTLLLLLASEFLNVSPELLGKHSS